MSIAAIADHQPALPVPSRVGQGTHVEQSRAIAEVQAAVVVAQQVPRSITRAERDMRRSCAQKSLAEKAFYRFPRGRETVSGPSVQLARELARCFGNVQYGVTELRRDDSYGQSEMQAWAWDLETNTRSSTTFIVPHRRDKRGGPEALTDMRDIYENNANNGARRLREMIFAILPGWYTEDAVAACYETLAADSKNGKGEQIVKECIEGFGRFGVRQAQLEEKVGGPVAKWTPYDIAQLQVIYRSLVRGETSTEEEFGTTAGRVTAEEITGQSKPAQRRRGAPIDASPADEAPPTPPSEPAGEAPDEEPSSSDRHTKLVGIVQAHFKRLGFTDGERDQRLAATAALAGIAGTVRSTNDMDEDELSTVADALARCKNRDALIALMVDGEAAGDD